MRTTRKAKIGKTLRRNLRDLVYEEGLKAWVPVGVVLCRVDEITNRVSQGKVLLLVGPELHPLVAEVLTKELDNLTDTETQSPTANGMLPKDNTKDVSEPG